VRFDILTLFPEPLEAWLEFSILKRARDRGLIEIELIDLRTFTSDTRRTVDDQPYGGGVGMLMKPEPLAAAIEQSVAADRARGGERSRVILLTPAGRRLEQSVLEELAREQHLVLLAGRYEGIDDRIRQLFVTDEISLGDFVLTGGELAAAVIVDGVSRLVPGVLGKDESSHDESFTSGLLEYPQYTRPPVFRGLSVPGVLLGGNHSEIKKWREREALLKTAAVRPDLLPPDWRERLSPPPKRRRRSRSKIEPPDPTMPAPASLEPESPASASPDPESPAPTMAEPD
jgi:tRNA (guanine37-N1)-methyltransferase